MAQEAKDDIDDSRKSQYSYGKRKVTTIMPSKGVPSDSEAAKKPTSKLEPLFVHGYFGNDKQARANLCLSQDGKSLIYYMASVGIVYDYGNNTQKFFCGHNDDVTCVSVDPRSGSTLVATGQKDPKDRPGEGKELPKICIWDYKTMKLVSTIPDVCWGRVSKLQWSTTGMLYCVGGDPDQTLKGWNSKDLETELIKTATTKNEILGFRVNSDPTACEDNVKAGIVDELVFYGAGKYSYLALTKTSKFDEDCPLQGAIKGIATSKFKRGIEKAFVCAEFLPKEGLYAVGAVSGALYLNKGEQCISVVDGHTKAVGDMIYDSTQDLLIAVGFDKLIRKFVVKQPKNLKKAKILEQVYQSGEINVKQTPDFVLKPKAIVYNENSGTLFIGNKSNQIISCDGLNGQGKKAKGGKAKGGKGKGKKKKGADESKDDEKYGGGATESAQLVLDGHEDDTWAVCAHPKEPYFGTAGYDGRIKIWNALEKKCIFSLECMKKKFNCGAWSPSGSCIVFGSEDSTFLVFRWDPAKKTAVFETEMKIAPKRRNGPVEPLSCMKFNNGSSLLAVSHMDGNVYIYNVKNDPKSGKYAIKRWKDALKHTGGAPTDVQWSNDSSIIKTFTRDYEICHWKLNLNTKKSEFLPSIPDPDKVQFFGDPLMAGWDVQGLFQKGWDGTDLNNLSLSKDKKMIVAGDDFGRIRMHNYPAIDPEACDVYTGHAEFVVGVQFLADDSQVATTGGADMSVFQWKVC